MFRSGTGKIEPVAPSGINFGCVPRSALNCPFKKNAMPERNQLLHAMLWALGISACCGVVAVIVQGGWVWRIFGTAIATAVACAILIPVSMLVDRRKWRTPGLVGMSVVITEFVAALVLIWEIPRLLGNAWWDESVGLSMAFVAIGAVALMASVRVSMQPAGRYAGLVGSLVVSTWFVAFMIPTWGGRWMRNDERWWISGLIIAATGALSFLALIGVGTRPRRVWRSAGVVGSVVAAFLWLLDTWSDHDSELGFLVYVVCLSAAIVIGHANVVLYFPLQRGQFWLRNAAIVSAIGAMVFVDVLWLQAEFRFLGSKERQLLNRLASAAGILASCATLALCVLARMNRRIDFEMPAGEFSKLSVICPRCRSRQNLAAGDSNCSKCGLRFSIRIEEPRCPSCAYLLVGLTSDRCPECGALVVAGTQEAS